MMDQEIARIVREVAAMAAGHAVEHAVPKELAHEIAEEVAGEVAKAAAKEVLKEFLQRLGVEDGAGINQLRNDLAWLRAQREFRAFVAKQSLIGAMGVLALAVLTALWLGITNAITTHK